jgi:hypothetical protein
MNDAMFPPCPAVNASRAEASKRAARLGHELLGWLAAEQSTTQYFEVTCRRCRRSLRIESPSGVIVDSASPVLRSACSHKVH